MLSINGVAVATPSVFEYVISDLDGESNRSSNGLLYRDRIASKVKLSLEWGPLSIAECSTLLQATKDVFFNVTYPDAMVGTIVTKSMYVGDRTAPMYAYIDGEAKWKGLKMNFIER